MADRPEAITGVHEVQPPRSTIATAGDSVFLEHLFQRTLAKERKRTERSGKPFLLMLVDIGNSSSIEKRRRLFSGILSALLRATRETDVIGWYKKDIVVGVIFTEITAENKSLQLEAMLTRMSELLRAQLGTEQFNQISISRHLFPEDWDHDAQETQSNPVLYPDLVNRESLQRFPRILKRIMDVLGSIIGIVILSPLFLVIAVAIKLTSQGPILFSQERVGQYGTRFRLLKFRSMCVNNDDGNHREYVRQLIAGTASTHSSNGRNGTGQGVYKLTDDERITPIGSWLRRSSIDELPQLFNVLNGEMSLVGPRPPVSYEVSAYGLWHRTRLLVAKPGITGLWQVSGRNRVTFDEMVRLDLAYVRSWSPWLDIEILLRTPRAVLEGAH